MSGPTIEATGSRVLAVSQVLGRQNGRPMQGWRGSVEFGVCSGDVLRFTTVLNRGDHRGFVDLEHLAGLRGGVGKPQAYRIWLRATSQPFGGLRWWFVCPRTGDIVVKLFLPNGADRFASRRAYKLDYNSQRVTAAERANNRAWKKRLAMGGKTGVPFGTPLDKPLWQHWRTWDRDCAELQHLEERTISVMSASLRRFIGLSRQARQI